MSLINNRVFDCLNRSASAASVAEARMKLEQLWALRQKMVDDVSSTKNTNTGVEMLSTESTSIISESPNKRSGK